MAIRIKTSEYIRTYGRRPKGIGLWGFRVVSAQRGLAPFLFVEGLNTHREACALIRKRLRAKAFKTSCSKPHPDHHSSPPRATR